jgi:hypothetical protein
MNKELFLHLTCFIKKSKPNKEDYLLQKEIRIASQKYMALVKIRDYCIYERDLFVIKEVLNKRGMYE